MRRWRLWFLALSNDPRAHPVPALKDVPFGRVLVRLKGARGGEPPTLTGPARAEAAQGAGARRGAMPVRVEASTSKQARLSVRLSVCLSLEFPASVGVSTCVVPASGNVIVNQQGATSLKGNYLSKVSCKD